MDPQRELWQHLITDIGAESTLHKALKHVAEGLSGMTRAQVSCSQPRVKTIPLAQVATHAGGPEAEMVGIYLRMESGLRGQAILILPLTIALNLVDLLMENRPGSSTKLGLMERSALAELGNLAISYFLNAVAEATGQKAMLQPSPPAVVVDMLGAIMNIVAAPAGMVSDELVVIESILRDAARTVWVRFWVLPDPEIDWSHRV